MSRKLVVLLALAAVVAAVGPASAGNDYTDPAYAARDLKNMRESVGRNAGQMSDPAFLLDLVTQTQASYNADQLAQAQDPTHPAISPGLLFPGWYTGNPQTYATYRDWLGKGRVKEVRFRARTGALLYGQVWKPAADGVYPAISITPGSVQAASSMYWWAAEDLADHGYIVLTFDAQGQGRSDSLGHSDDALETPTLDGVPSQQALNFLEATVDAVDFLLSTPSTPYRWAFRDDAANGYATFDPFSGQIQYLGDGHANVGIAGHSFGAMGVLFAQDPQSNTVNADNIRAAVSWDPGAVKFPGEEWLRMGLPQKPNVPTMIQNGESFAQPSFNPQRPDPESRKTNFNAWRLAGIDTMQIAPRAATHMEWAYVPYVVAASSWGNGIAKWYTRAWFDKYLKHDPTADARLLTKQYNVPGVCADEANCYSIYYKSAYWFHSGGGGVLHSCDDMARIAETTACPDTDP